MKSLLACATFLSFVGCHPLYAQTTPSCTNREAMEQTITQTFKEQLVFEGLSGATAVFQMWLNPTTGTWSLTITDPKGGSCMVAAGGNGVVSKLTPEGEKI